MRAQLEEFLGDPRILDDLSDPLNRAIMVIGGVDSGKTTLVETLARFLCGSTDLGIVDLDVGQSQIGPPTTVSWGKTGSIFEGWDKIRAEDIYFTGTLSPEGNLLPCLTGAGFVTSRALSSAGRVVIDTSGFVSSPSATVLKTNKIDLLNPDIVIGLEKDHELEDIIAPFSPCTAPKTFRVPVPRRIRLKTPEMRAGHRLKKFSDYFFETQTRDVSLRKFSIRFTVYPADISPWSLAKRIISFRDTENRDLAIGIIENYVPEEDTLSVRTPLKDFSGVVTLMIGKAISPL